jgi:hypothetical protein
MINTTNLSAEPEQAQSRYFVRWLDGDYQPGGR